MFQYLTIAFVKFVKWTEVIEPTICGDQNVLIRDQNVPIRDQNCQFAGVSGNLAQWTLTFPEKNHGSFLIGFDKKNLR